MTPECIMTLHMTQRFICQNCFLVTLAGWPHLASIGQSKQQWLGAHKHTQTYIKPRMESYIYCSRVYQGFSVRLQ